MNTIENCTRSDNHLQQPEGQKPHRSGPSEPDNVAFARNKRIALLEELSWYRDPANAVFLEDEDRRRIAMLEEREAEYKAILNSTTD